MKAVNFEEANIKIAENQAEYETLPARVYDDDIGEVISCWELSDEEVKQILKTKKIWVSMLTFRKGITPIMLMIEKPEMKERQMIIDKGMICLKKM